MKKIYIVTFEKHADCQIRNIVFHCEAENAKDACQIAKQAWSEKTAAYPFKVHAVKARTQDISFLKIRNWKCQEISGAACMNEFYCTDFRTWRSNGRNLYGA